VPALLTALVLALLSSAGTAQAPPGSVLLRDGFDRPNGPHDLIANEWAYWHPTDPLRVGSETWQLTSGSLLSVGGHGWTGVPDDRAPDRYSQSSTDSQVFRLNTARSDFGDVEQAVDVRINGFAGSRRFPALPWDGVVLWPRYVTEFHLYFAYLLRKDGRVAITKKCPGRVSGGSVYNGGTYFDLTKERRFGPTIPGRWYRLASSVQDNSDRSVTIRIFQNGRLAAQATDRGVGCAPMRAPTKLGIRSDNVDANFGNYQVTQLSAGVPGRCPGSLVGARRGAALRHLARRHRRHSCPF
jgi:hypothetical protein